MGKFWRRRSGIEKFIIVMGVVALVAFMAAFGVNGP